MSESRLFKIIYYLLDKGQATAPELAREFEVSVRTIYRDIDALSGAGIPIYTETGRNGGISFLNDSILDRVLFSDKEKQELLLALQSISATGNTSGTDVLTKLSALFHMNADDWMEVDFSRWSKRSHDNNKFAAIRSSILHRQKLKIVYEGSSGIQSERIIHPYKLIYKSLAWYLNAFCEEKQAFRIFKFNRIISYELLKEIYHPVPYVNELEISDPPQNPVPNIVLQFSRKVAYRVYDEFDETQIQHLDNGDVIVTSDMPIDDWLCGYILSFGTLVEVIKPEQVRTIIMQKAKDIYEKYSKT